MKEVTVTKYESLNGRLYDNQEAAERADTIWKEDNVLEDLEKELKYLRANMARLLKKEIRRPAHAAEYYLLTSYEKHGESHFLGYGIDGLLEAYWRLFKYRMASWGDWGANYGCLSKKDKALADHILEHELKHEAAGLIIKRSDYQYERVDYTNLPLLNDPSK